MRQRLRLACLNICSDKPSEINWKDYDYQSVLGSEPVSTDNDNPFKDDNVAPRRITV